MLKLFYKFKYGFYQYFKTKYTFRNIIIIIFSLTLTFLLRRCLIEIWDLNLSNYLDFICIGSFISIFKTILYYFFPVSYCDGRYEGNWYVDKNSYEKTIERLVSHRNSLTIDLESKTRALLQYENLSATGSVAERLSLSEHWFWASQSHYKTILERKRYNELIESINDHYKRTNNLHTYKGPVINIDSTPNGTPEPNNTNGNNNPSSRYYHPLYKPNQWTSWANYNYIEPKASTSETRESSNRGKRSNEDNADAEGESSKRTKT